MCGRLAVTIDPLELARFFDVPSVGVDLEALTALGPRFNVAPGQSVVVIRSGAARRSDPDPPARCMDALYWGLVPPWAKDISVGQRMINARGETLAQKSAFKKAYQKRRCIVVCDGFYEWQRHGAQRRPYFISLRNREPMVLAGLWERWWKPKTRQSGPGDPDQKGARPEPPKGDMADPPLESVAIVTTTPNQAIASIHDRMPVIIPKALVGRWIESDALNEAEEQALIRSAPDETLELKAVSSHVNRPDNQGPACHEPAEDESKPPRQLTLF